MISGKFVISLRDETSRTGSIAINVKKSVCTRIGPRCRSPCVQLVMSDGSELCWVAQLGINFAFRLCNTNVVMIDISVLFFTIW